MSHLSLVSALPETFRYGGKTLLERTTGKFYTPNVLAIELAHRIAQSTVAVNGKIAICDPFCGDGRLVAEVMFAAAKSPTLIQSQWAVRINDVDEIALSRAASYITDVATALRIDLALEAVAGDSFMSSTPNSYFDVVVTNPPWEHIKPDTRELREMSADEQGAYRHLLRARSIELDKRFPHAASDGQWAGWGTNLARCGWELSLGLCKPEGVLGIVLPATLMADQASVKMRKFAFSKSTLLSIASYPAEARLFERVDQAVVTLVGRAAPPKDGQQKAALRTYRADLEVAADLQLTRGPEQLDNEQYVLPVGFGAAADHLNNRLSHLSTLGALEVDAQGGLWTGRELDETRIAEKTAAGGIYPFIKGKMIERHKVKVQPTLSVRSEFARNPSIKHERIVWRDVSRSSQARRMITTIIPPNWVAGNSLHVAFFRDGDPVRLRALYAVVSSYVFEFQVRMKLATGHMSLGVVRSARIPELLGVRAIATLAEAAERALLGADNSLLEVAVAKAYGFEREDYAELLGCFPKISIAERDMLLSNQMWN